MNIERITVKIKSLGFTAYEAKAYIALLQQNPVTRYELSKNSGVPRSAIYDVIRKLEQIGAVNGTYQEPEKYIPLPPEQLFALLERQFNERVEEARESLKGFDTQIEPGHLWNIVGYKNMLHKAREMIGKAESSIYISIWKRECQALLPELIQALNRGITITAFSFTELDLDIKNLYTYKIPEPDLEKTWDHKIILVIDQRELLMGDAEMHYAKKTAWTDNTAIVDIATNHIILDITLYGIRMNQDVSETVSSMQKQGYENLDNMLKGRIQKDIHVLNNHHHHL